MKMEQLFQLLTVFRAGSINKAAQELFLSQSTLSQSMRNLENELGAQLLIRSSNGVGLTALGEEFLKQAEPICEQFTSLGALCTRRTVESPALSLSVFYTGFIAHAYTRLVRAYASQNPNFSICEDTFTQMAGRVSAGRAHLGVFCLISTSRLLCLHHLEQNGLSFQHLCSMDAYVMLRKDHPALASGNKRLSMEMLNNYPYTGSRDKLTQTDWIALAGTPHRSVHSIWTCSRENMTELILSTDVFSIVPFNGAVYPDGLPYPNGAIRMVPIEGPGLDYELGYIKRQGTELTQPALDYILFLKQELGIASEVGV